MSTNVEEIAINFCYFFEFCWMQRRKSKVVEIIDYLPFKGDFKISPPEIKRIANKSRKKIPSYMVGRKKEEDRSDDFIPPVFLLKSNDPNFSYRLDPESKDIL